MSPLSPEALRPHYSAFLGDKDRVLLTGHSHQAWPDAARAGVVEAFEDAAEHVDDKWSRATEAADFVRATVAAELGGLPEDIALAQNTHELVARFLSALDWRRRHLVTTAGEFHSIARQLARLEEEGIEVTRVPVEPLSTLSARLASAVRADTAAVLASTVLFETSAIVPGLREAAEAARAVGAEILLDSYHHFGVVPWQPIDRGAFVVGGGYKYAQWGEGCCFMRVPAGCTLRPVNTGWFSDFGSLASAQEGPIGYGSTGADRFAGSTYDPTSHYRARAVIRFFAEQEMSVARLRELSLRQTGRLLDGLGNHEVITPREARGGFVTVRQEGASDVVSELRARGVFVDARRDRLRFGPAPYVTNDELDRALSEFAGVVSS